MSAMVAQEPPVSVNLITGTSTPDSDYCSTLEPATEGTLPLLVQPNLFGAHPFKVLRDVAGTHTDVHPRWPWSGPSLPEQLEAGGVARAGACLPLDEEFAGVRC